MSTCGADEALRVLFASTGQGGAALKRRNIMLVKNLQKTFFFSAVIFCQNLLRLPAKDAIVVQTPCHDRAKRALCPETRGGAELVWQHPL